MKATLLLLALLAAPDGGWLTSDLAQQYGGYCTTGNPVQCFPLVESVHPIGIVTLSPPQKPGTTEGDTIWRAGPTPKPKPIHFSFSESTQTIVFSVQELDGGHYRVVVNQPDRVVVLKPDGGLYR
jgi:hypothetical protein